MLSHLRPSDDRANPFQVFGDEDFCFETPVFGGQALDHQSHKGMVEAIQAAYIVCLYQNWEGSDASRRRIRRYRFSNLVSVCSPFMRGSMQLIELEY